MHCQESWELHGNYFTEEYCQLIYILISQVGWIHLDAKSILAIHHVKVTPNDRIDIEHQVGSFESVTRYSLKISGAQESDSGCYACYINMDPTKKQVGCIDIASE